MIHNGQLSGLPSTFTTATALARGVHPRELYGWRDAGEIIELSRGVFRLADAPAASYPDLLAVAYRVPRAIVCCVSAAVVHDLTDELPARVQVAVSKRSHVPRIDHRRAPCPSTCSGFLMALGVTAPTIEDKLKTISDSTVVHS